MLFVTSFSRKKLFNSIQFNSIQKLDRLFFSKSKCWTKPDLSRGPNSIRVRDQMRFGSGTKCDLGADQIRFGSRTNFDLVSDPNRIWSMRAKAVPLYWTCDFSRRRSHRITAVIIVSSQLQLSSCPYC